MGTLAELKDNSVYLGYNFISIVNFYTGYDSNAYVIANDGSDISNSYKFILSTPNQISSQSLSDFSDKGGSVTFACSDCNQFYITQLIFEDSSSGFVTFQGKSPSQTYLSKILNYNASTFTQNQLPQLIPTNKFTLYIYKCNLTLTINNGDDKWTTPYIGRTGLITSATVWDNLLENGSFEYIFRDSSQFFSFFIDMTNMVFGGEPTDDVTIMIGISSDSSKDYCPGGWNVMRKADQTPQTCDAMGGVKCQKPYSCVHSRCGMDFCCAYSYKIEQWKRQQEIEADIKEAEMEDDEL
uniref:CUB_2 domain-containing protein n=1 Tax=Caenorhabditis tropicalis TaxID=1561998 RepID=A0A1I7V3M9_9PELO